MLRRVILFTVLGLFVALGLYLAFVLKWSYSSGERAGWIQKFSRKGWICKTWEGELIMVSLPGSLPEKFAFTVRDDDIAQRVNKAMGDRVTLHYEEHRGLPGSCFGDTGYWVDAVTQFAQPGPAPGPAEAPK
jgi:hypothetical protein